LIGLKGELQAGRRGAQTKLVTIKAPLGFCGKLGNLSDFAVKSSFACKTRQNCAKLCCLDSWFARIFFIGAIINRLAAIEPGKRRIM
jgi:hypothetical protein